MWLKSIGLGIIQGWLWLFFLKGPLLYSTASLGGNPETVSLTFLLSTAVCFLTIAKMGSLVSPLVKKPFLLIISMSLMTIGSLSAGLLTLDLFSLSANLSAAMGALIAGIGSALLISAWGERYSTLPAHQASLAFGIAVTIGTIIFFVISKLSLTPAVLITALIPLISGFLLLREANAVNRQESTIPGQPPASFPFPMQFVILIVLFYLTGGLMYKMIASGQQFGYYENFWLTNIVYFAVCLLAGVIVYFNPDIDLRYLYRPILPLLGIGFALFPILHHSVISFTFLQTGFALFDLYTWVLFAYLAARHRYQISVVSWGMFLITSSIFTGEIVMELFSRYVVAVKETDLVSLFAALLMFTGTLVLKGKRETFSGWDAQRAINEIACSSGNDSDANPVTRQPLPVLDQQQKDPASHLDLEEQIPFNGFARKFKLTAREKQITELLLEGRNNPYIRETLNVSNNTLKTHLRNIYRKLSINDRQELLDLFINFKD